MFRRNFIFALLLGLSATWSESSFALFPEDVKKQRANYQAALSALKAKNYSKFNQLSNELSGYVLHGHLQYEYLKKGIDVVPEPTIKHFIEDNQHTHLGENLRGHWLRYLARRGQWKTFMDNYRNIDEDAELACYRLGHLLSSGQTEPALMEEVRQLWLTGRRRPSACDPVFKAWRKAGYMTRELVWERIKLVMERRRLSLATALASYLPSSERIWVQRWKAMHRRPQRELSNIRYPVETPVARQIVTHGVVRLAYRDPEAAMDRWRKLKVKYQFFGEDENYVLRMTGILAAQNHSPNALEWLSAVSVEADDEKSRLWRVKAALRAGEWNTAKHFLASLTQDEQRKPQWRYWQARTLEKTGDPMPARTLYGELAKERNYYGFLAADRLGQDYSLQHVSVEVSQEEIDAMMTRAGTRVAQELYAMGKVVPARRQWNWLTRWMNNQELQVAAVIARQWGWHDRAILTVNKSDHLDDLDLRFPVIYRDIVEINAERTGIDPGWIYGVMRQESAFMADARSHAGALGLMQLMPRTGRQTGRKLKMQIRSNAAILKIENNLLLGTSYLKSVLDRNDGNQALATASYNAGPHRVKRWLPQEQSLDADIWIDTIPYKETRNYVKNVFSYTAIYDLRLGGERTHLHERMPEVDPKD